MATSDKIIAALYFFGAGILFDCVVRGESLIFTIPLLILCITVGIIKMDLHKT